MSQTITKNNISLLKAFRFLKAIYKF